jgi:hypothetical protein
MSGINIKAVAFTVLILLAASFSVLANENPAHPFNLQTPVLMNGAEIPVGNYQLTLDPTKSGVRVTLWKQGKFIATAPGTWVKAGLKHAEDAVLVRVNADGSRSIIEIRLAGFSKTILLGSSDETVRVSVKSMQTLLPPGN